MLDRLNQLLPTNLLQDKASGNAEGSGLGLGGGALNSGLPDFSGKAGAFARMLEGALKTGGVDALGVLSQSTLGGSFIAQMTGVEAGKLSELSDVNALMDSVLGGGKSGGGMDLMSLMGGGDKSGGGLDMMGLLGSGMPGAGGSVDMTKVAEMLRTLSKNDPASAVGGAQMDQAMAQARHMLSKQAEQDIATLKEVDGVAPDVAKDMAEQVSSLETAQAVAGPKPPMAPNAPPRVDPSVRTVAGLAAQSGGAARTFDAASNALARKAYGVNIATNRPAHPFGDLSARFESGGSPGAVGYDRVGGTSYGIYQISSKAGTFDRFLSFLDRQAPDMAQRLRAAGDADTGSKTGPMPSAWKTLAHEQGDKFARLQHDFIKESHFQPALKKISDLTGIDLTARHQAVAQVLWSTAVQHGATGSANIFARALQAVGNLDSLDSDKSLIEAVYASRSRQFGSSSERVQGAVKSRFEGELKAALSMLDGAEGLFDSNV